MNDKVKLDSPFKISCNRCGGPCELNAHDRPKAECPKCGTLERDAFTVTCPNCGSTSPELDDQIRMGSSWTGLYGSYDVRCDCGNEQTILDP